MFNGTLRTILQVWEKAKAVDGRNPDIWRQDFAGAWIRKDSYGQRDKYGWVIDRLKPLCLGGTNDLDNLLVLHWKNNLSKGQNYPEFETMVCSEGNANINKVKKWKVSQK